MYDPRIRPWFHLAASAPRIVLIGISTQYGMLGHKDSLLTAFDTLLFTLTEKDYVNVMAIGNIPLLPSCYQDGFVPVTDSVRAELRNFVKRLAFGGKSAWTSALSKYEVMLRGMGYDQPNNQLQSDFIILNDGKFVEKGRDVLAEVTAMKARNCTKFHIHTYNMGAAPSALAKEISCLTNGISGSVNTKDLKLHEYGSRAGWGGKGSYRIMDSYVELLQYWGARVQQGLSRFTFPYTDFSTGHSVITVVFPVFAKGKFYGVLGEDVVVSTLMNDVEKMRLTARSYNFVVYNSGLGIAGLTMVHPAMKNAGTPVDIGMLEGLQFSLANADNTTALSLREQILTSDSGMRTINVQHRYETGTNVGSITHVTHINSYFWKKIYFNGARPADGKSAAVRKSELTVVTVFPDFDADADGKVRRMASFPPFLHAVSLNFIFVRVCVLRVCQVFEEAITPYTLNQSCSIPPTTYLHQTPWFQTGTWDPDPFSYTAKEPCQRDGQQVYSVVNPTANDTWASNNLTGPFRPVGADIAFFVRNL